MSYLTKKNILSQASRHQRRRMNPPHSSLSLSSLHYTRRILDTFDCATIPQALHCLNYHIPVSKSVHPKDSPCFAPIAKPSGVLLTLLLHRSIHPMDSPCFAPIAIPSGVLLLLQMHNCLFSMESPHFLPV